MRKAIHLGVKKIEGVKWGQPISKHIIIRPLIEARNTDEWRPRPSLFNTLISRFPDSSPAKKGFSFGPLYYGSGRIVLSEVEVGAFVLILILTQG